MQDPLRCPVLDPWSQSQAAGPSPGQDTICAGPTFKATLKGQLWVQQASGLLRGGLFCLLLCKTQQISPALFLPQTAQICALPSEQHGGLLQELSLWKMKHSFALSSGLW